MKRRVVWIVLAAEAAICVLINLLHASLGGVFSVAAAFPFEQIGLGLRALSLSGGLGNAIAIALYAAICLLPAALLLLRKKRKLCWEDGLLVLLSATLFAVLYLMINPQLIAARLGGLTGLAVGKAGLAIGKAVFGSMAYSVIVGYFVLRVLRLCTQSSTDRLQKYMTALLYLLNMLFVYLAFGACFKDLLDSIAALQTGNAGNERLLGASYVFLALRFAADTLPYLLDVFVAFAAIRLLDELHADRYSPRSAEAAERLVRLCRGALAVEVLVNIALNLLQLVFAKKLMEIHSSVQMPVLSIAFALGVFLLARFVAENKRLKEENDLFV